MRDKLEYLLVSFEMHCKEGMTTDQAWSEALSDYHYVYLTDDGRLPIARAATRALLSLDKATADSRIVDKQP